MEYTIINAASWSWNDCPPEILIIMFQYLDAKSLIKCMVVNRKWKSIAETVCQKVGWETITKQGLYNDGIHLISTGLGWRDKIVNSCLWSFYDVFGCTVTKLNEYNIAPRIHRSYIYKDNMVIVDSAGVTHRNVRNYEITKQRKIKSIFYMENDHVTMNATYVGLGRNKKMNLHSKSCSDTSESHLQTSRCATIISIWQIFHLAQETFYTLQYNGELHSHRWDGQDWIRTVIARYYGMPDYMVALSKYRENFYGLSESNSLWCLNSALMQVKKICSLNLPLNMLQEMKGALFYYLCSVVYEYGVIARETLDDFYNKLPFNISCAKFYGGIIFVGYFDGKVKACKPTYLAHSNIFDLRIHEVCNILDFLSNTNEDPAVMDVNVYEDHHSHHLFIRTGTTICQVKLEPRYIVFDDDY